MVSMLQSNVVTVLTRGKAHIFTFTVQNNHIYSFVYFYISMATRLTYSYVSMIDGIV